MASKGPRRTATTAGRPRKTSLKANAGTPASSAKPKSNTVARGSRASTGYSS